MAPTSINKPDQRRANQRRMTYNIAPTSICPSAIHRRRWADVEVTLSRRRVDVLAIICQPVRQVFAKISPTAGC